jgi:hypothetical protein
LEKAGYNVSNEKQGNKRHNSGILSGKVKIGTPIYSSPSEKRSIVEFEWNLIWDFFKLLWEIELTDFTELQTVLKP